MNSRTHIYVKGRVQGVFYRTWAKEQADKLRVVGTVANLGDGRVEIVVEGQRRVLEKFAELLKEGPRLAKVEHADVVWETATNEFKTFEILR